MKLRLLVFILFAASIALGSPPDRRGDASKHLKRGNAVLARGDVEGALREFRAAVKIDPNFRPAHDSLGVTLENLGDLDGAIAEYREAVRVEPDDPFAHDHLGRVLLRKGDADTAIAEHSEAIRLKPNEAVFHRNLGLAFEQKGNNEAALEEYHTASQLAPEDSLIRSDYQRLQRKLQKEGEARPGQATQEARAPQSVSKDVSPPAPIFKPDPAYTKQAGKKKVTGVVVLLIVVDTRGNVTDVQQVSKPLGGGLDEKAIETVRTWKFNPALRNGVPVRVRVTVEISFRLFQ